MLTPAEKAVIVEALGAKLLELQKQRKRLQDDGFHEIARDLYAECDRVIDVQNRVRSL